MRSLQDAYSDIRRLLPLTAIVAPGSLTVSPVETVELIDTKVPQPNFSNFSSFGSSNDANALTPDERITRMAFQVATSGRPVPVDPSFLNSTYKIEFDGPAMRCASANDSIIRNCTTSFGSNRAYGKGTYTSYVSWPGPVPPVSASARGSNSPSGSTNYDATSEDVARLFVMTNTGSWDRYLETDHSPILWRRIVNVTECRLFNATYSVNFKFQDGIQSQEVSLQSWNTAVALDTGTLRKGPAKPHGAIMQAVGSLLIGSTSVSLRGMDLPRDTSLTRKLVNVDWNDADSIPRALEQLFENVTLSLVSNNDYV